MPYTIHHYTYGEKPGQFIEWIVRDIEFGSLQSAADYISTNAADFNEAVMIEIVSVDRYGREIGPKAKRGKERT